MDYHVIWTRRDGRVARWTFANRQTAAATAASLALGWRKDARVI